MAACRRGVPRRGPADRGAARDARRRPRGRRRATLVFFGAKGGAGTTTVAVNCAVELARLTQAADDHRRSEAVSRRGRAVPRRPAALHACSTPSRTCTASIATSCASWWSRHKSGLEILAGVGAVRSAGRGGRRRGRGAVPRADAQPRLHRGRRRQLDQLVHAGGALRRRHDLPRHEPRRAVGPQRAAAGGSRPPARRGRRAGAHRAEPRRRAAR